MHFGGNHRWVPLNKANELGPLFLFSNTPALFVIFKCSLFPPIRQMTFHQRIFELSSALVWL